jgi:hypothetical protein
MIAGWSSLVARWAHNPKVGGSNPPPATIKSYYFIQNITLGSYPEASGRWFESTPRYNQVILFYTKYYVGLISRSIATVVRIHPPLQSSHTILYKILRWAHIPKHRDGGSNPPPATKYK